MPRQAATLRSFSAEDAATATGVSVMLMMSGLGLDFRLAREKRANGQHIHLGSLEAVDRLLWCAYNRLILVEARVQDHRDPGFPAKRLDQIVVQRILFSRHGLQSASVVHVVHGAEAFPLLRANFVHMQHVGRWMIVLEILVLRIGQYRRRKGTEPLTVFDASVQHILHIGQAGVRDDRAIAEGARSPLHASLKPPYNIALHHLLGNSVEQRRALQSPILYARASQG